MNKVVIHNKKESNIQIPIESKNETHILDLKNNQIDNLQDKIGKAKEVMKNFASDLKSKIEDYKPPVMKFTLNLRPGNLGSVEITLLKRGKSLHVNIGSNQGAIQMLAQNSMEFKNALSNMGLNDVQMNFNLNDGQKDGNSQNNQRQNQQQRRGFKEYSDIDDKVDELESIELTIPKYI
jgi:flagellar hook-length control protein FliK